MGNLIDLEKSEENLRCNHVKLPIVIINLIGPPISLMLLIFGIIRMLLLKNRKSFLTNLIILIFLSEIVQCLSKLIQVLKYDYPDLRDNKELLDYDTPRGKICQVQICFALFSDFLSLLSTLLLSLRCYDVINNKKGFFDRGYNGIISISSIIIISLILSIIFLIIDRSRFETTNIVSYRYDVRDRCTYWCWLEHVTSLFCYGLYWVILICNIVFAFITNKQLKKGYQKLLEENNYSPTKENDLNSSLNEGIKEDEDMHKEKENKKNNNLSPEDKKRIEQLKIMEVKCLIYPCVTICFWLFAATYRIIDDIFMKEIDSIDPYKGQDKENKLFEDHKIFQFMVQTFLFLYTLLSSIRGILYGFSFIVFEEKIFFNFFKKIWEKCFKHRDSIKINGEKDELVRNSETTTSSRIELNLSSNKDKNDMNNIEMNANDCDNDNNN